MASHHDQIEHPGIIDRVEDNRIWVSIQPQSACGNCHSKTYCGMAEVAEKIVEVSPPDKTRQYEAGQNVVVTLRQSLGYKALLLGYLLPFVILVVTLIISIWLFNDEALAAILSIAVMIPYFSFLYLKRDIIKKSFRFYIK
jgi:positive regulator of sigma E activity